MGGKLPHNGRRDHARKRARRLIHRKQGATSSSRAICASFPARSAYQARATCWNSAAARRAFRSAGREGLWQPYPVEYKRGQPKESTADDAPALWTGDVPGRDALLRDPGAARSITARPRRRTEVDFTPALRQEVRALLEEMHALYARGSTPKVKPTKGCNACSLKGLCLPKLMRSKSVSAYLRGAMEGEQ